MLTCRMCERCWETYEEGALYITEVYPQHIGDPPEIFHFCSYICIQRWTS